MNRWLSACCLIAATTLTGCDPAEPPDGDARQDMREFVIRIAAQARAANPDFIVIPQNGQELISLDGEASGPLAAEYAAAIDGQAREDLLYGYVEDNVATPVADREYLIAFMDRAEAEGIQALITDYCSTPAFVDDSYARNSARQYVSFAAHRRELDAIPPRPANPVNENAADVDTLDQAKNFLYLINPGEFTTSDAFIAALAATNFDILLIDAFFNESPLTADQVAALQTKANGGRRIVLAYMSIGEAEDYRFYWQAGWRPGSPDWIEAENPNFEGNFIVQYWRPEWQSAILNADNGYLSRVVAAGFDGVYLDIIDAFEYFE